MKTAGDFGARRGLDVLAVKVVVVHDDLVPVSFSGVRLFEFGEARDGLVRRHVARNLNRLRRPGRLLRRSVLLVRESNTHDCGSKREGNGSQFHASSSKNESGLYHEPDCPEEELDISLSRYGC